MTRDQAVRLLERHGWKPWDLTEYERTGEPISKSSFYAQLGVRAHYTEREVLDWLGY